MASTEHESAPPIGPRGGESRGYARRVLAGSRALVRLVHRDPASVNAAIALAERRRDRGHDKRVILRGIALFLSLAVPGAFIAYVVRVRKTVGFNWLGAVGALVAISVVIAVGVVAGRRDT